jgi:hypothetical protein
MASGARASVPNYCCEVAKEWPRVLKRLYHDVKYYIRCGIALTTRQVRNADEPGKRNTIYDVE